MKAQTDGGFTKANSSTAKVKGIIKQWFMHSRLAKQEKVSKLAGKKINSQNTYIRTPINTGIFMQMQKDLVQWEGKAQTGYTRPEKKKENKTQVQHRGT